MPPVELTPPPARWRLTAAGFRCAVVGVTGLVLAVVTGRPDVLVVVTPLVVVAVWGFWCRPGAPLSVTAVAAHSELREGEVSRWRVVVPAQDVGLEVSLGLVSTARLALSPATGERTLSVVPGDGVEVDIRYRALRWGHQRIGPAAVAAASGWAAYQAGPVELPSVPVTVLPMPAVYAGTGTMPSPHGIVGLDRTRRAGSGSELLALRAFRAGDRLARVHWPSSLRTRSLMVVQTHAEEESHVVLCVDATSDLGERVGIDGPATSLDLTLRAAAALAEYHVGRGDRVTLRIFGDRAGMPLPPATGSTQLRLFLTALAGVDPATERRVDPVVVSSRLDPSALVVVLSPLVSRDAVAVVARLAAAGLGTVVVDTLPDHLGAGGTDPDALAWRVRRLTRHRDLANITARGIPVVTWRGPGSLDAVLRTLAIRSRAPRVTSW